MNSTIEEGEVPKLYLTSHMDTVVPAINVKPIVKMTATYTLMVRLF